MMKTMLCLRHEFFQSFQSELQSQSRIIWLVSITLSWDGRTNEDRSDESKKQRGYNSIYTRLGRQHAIYMITGNTKQLSPIASPDISAFVPQ